jgi:hypothetical protein
LAAIIATESLGVMKNLLPARQHMLAKGGGCAFKAGLLKLNCMHPHKP